VFVLELLFYAYIKRSKDNFYVIKGFAFALFLNFTTFYLLLKQAGLLDFAGMDSDPWGFGISGVLGALITFTMDRRKELIIDKFKNSNLQYLSMWWLAHIIFSSALFIVVASG
jgi:hypothetical protein